MPTKFTRFTDDDKKTRPYFAFNQEVVELLEQITPVEKALAVPYIRIHEIDPKTGAAKHEGKPMTLHLVTPPAFGASAEVRFRERPPVSLERVSIKNVAPKGLILYRTVQLDFAVHRPDVIFGERDPDADNWASLIDIGTVHVLEYGWQSSGKHPLLNGEGYELNDGGVKILVPAKRKITFQVINYDFKMTNDIQFKFTIHAVEAGNSALRNATIGSSASSTPDADPKIKGPRDLFSKNGRDALKKLQSDLASIPLAELSTGAGKTYKFGDFADKFLAPVIEDTFKRIGYKEVSLYIGGFNRRVGRPAAKFGGGNELKSIADFPLPLDYIQQKFTEVFRSGLDMTVYNFVQVFFDIFRAPDNWVHRRDNETDTGVFGDYSVPDVRLKTQTLGDKVALYIVDVKSETSLFTDNDRLKGNEGLTTSQVREKLKKNGIPYVGFIKANSYLTEANFEVVQDDRIKSLLIRQTQGQPRTGVTSRTPQDNREGSVKASEILYSSAIQGSVDMIGNFAFDTFGTVWLDFGVTRYSGLFFIMDKEDVIEPGSFVSRATFRSTGLDPLGTQGRPNKNKSFDKFNT